MPLTVGTRLGHYDVTALIGEGDMGQVYQVPTTWGASLGQKRVGRNTMTRHVVRSVSVLGVVSCLAWGLGPSPASAQHFPSDAAIKEIIRTRVAEDRAVGMVIGVLEADGSTRVVTFGEAGPGARALTPTAAPRWPHQPPGAAGLEPMWSQPIGGGYASFVVAHGVAFTIEQRREQEVVAAYDLATGHELWTHAWDEDFREPMGGPGPRATPAWHAGRVYALGATGQLWCLEADTGDVIWERDILSDSQATNLTWAMSAAPLVVDDLVIVQPGGAPGWSVVVYNRNTGDVVWHALDDVQAYTSPMTATLASVRQVLTVTASRAVGLDVRDGQLVWEHPWLVGPPPSMAQPVLIGDDRVFLSGSGAGATVIELSRANDRFTVETVWSNNRMKNKFSSSVLHEGYIYGLDGAILACIDAATGEIQWKGGRYGYGQLLLASGHLVVVTERGDLVLVRATPAGHEEVASSGAIEGKTWNVPAFADGKLLVRNARQMAAFDLRMQ